MTWMHCLMNSTIPLGECKPKKYYKQQEEDPKELSENTGYSEK